jgi:antagonist of KipI
MSIIVKRPGVLSTIQDLGRFGYQQYGVSTAGVMDEFAARTANELVGNDAGAPALEVTLAGAEFEFKQTCVIAICGADLGAELATGGIPPGKVPVGMACPLWTRLKVSGGTVLRFTRHITGCRAYIAVCGGFDVTQVLGSASTDLRAGFGGMGGRALRADDRLKIRGIATAAAAKSTLEPEATLFITEPWSISPYVLPNYSDHPSIRIIRGRDWERFSEESKKRLVSGPYEVTVQSNRMGYRLNGGRLGLENQAELLSEAVTMGTIQVPPDGQPIILMADRQPTGGYPIIGQVASVDLPMLAQAPPGSKLTFVDISLQEAQRLLIFREWELRMLREGLRLLQKADFA